jgi:hypothetical protein
MKYLMITFVSVFATCSQLFAQDEQQPVAAPEQEQTSDTTAVTSDTTTVTDEELRKYAIAMDSINDMKTSLLAEINNIVKNEGKMTNARYNELSKIAGDETKLSKVKATAAEKALLQKVADKKSQGTEIINQTFQSLAKDYVGAEAFNKIKKALASDNELRAKYDVMLKEVEKGR